MAKLELPDNAIAQGNRAERERIEKDYFAPTVDPDYPFGVLYQGEWETPFDGTAIAVRKHARALSKAGLPVLLKSFSNIVVSKEGVAEPVPTVGVPPEVKSEIGTLNETRVGHVVPLIKHMVIGNASKLARTLMRGATGPLDRPELRVGAQQAVYAATIVYSVWERSAIHPDIALHLSEVAECWVPCEQNKKLLLDAGINRVRVVPHPFSVDDRILRCLERSPHPKVARRFYAIGAWQPRKGFHELVGAFLRQFKPSDLASLTIKYSGGEWPGYPNPQQSLVHWLDDAEVQRNGWTASNITGFVTLIGKRLERSNIIRLHYQNNIYVCSSHGEAWCLPAFDAKLAGNRLVHVPWGGTADFAAPDDIAIPYTMEPVSESYGWEPNAEWAAFSVGDLMAALASAYPPERFELPEGFSARFREEAVGILMRDAVIEVSKKINEQAHKYYREVRLR